MSKKITLADLNPLESAVYTLIKDGRKTQSLENICNQVGRSPKEVLKVERKLRKHFGIRGRINKDAIVPEAFADDLSQVYTERVPEEDVESYFSSSFKIGATADNHISSYHSDIPLLHRMYDVFKREKVDVVLNAGNMIDGSLYFNQHSIHEVGVTGQVDLFLDVYPEIPGVDTLFVTGDDHESWFQKQGLNITEYLAIKAEKAGRKDLKFLGHIQADMYLIPHKGLMYNSFDQCDEKGNVKRHLNKPSEPHAIIRNMHGGGGTAYALSGKPQKIVESWEGGEKANLAVCGHYHKYSYDYIRNCHFIQLPCTEKQTDFMKKLNIRAHLGGVTVEIHQNEKSGVIEGVSPRYYPCIDRGLATDPLEWHKPHR